VPLDEFFHAFYEAWAQAAAKFTTSTNAKRSPRDMLVGERVRVQTFCKSTPRVTTFTRSVSYGYDEIEAAIWIETNDAETFVRGTNRHFFLPGRPLERRLRDYFDQSSEASTLVIAPEDDDYLTDRWGTKRLPNLGRVLFGQTKGEGMVVITIRDLPYRTPEEVYTLVVSGLEPPNFVEFTPPALPSWWREPSLPTLPEDDDEFVRFCIDVRTVVGEMLGAERTILITIRASCGNPRQAAAEALLGVAHSITHGVTLLVFTDYASTDAEWPARLAAIRDGISAAKIESGLPTFDAVIVDGRTLARSALSRPWIWSKHFGRQEPFHVISDREHLRQVLLQEPAFERSMPRSNVHPAVAPLLQEISTAAHIALSGAPGTGKSVALFQLADAAGGRPVVVRPNCLGAHAVQALRELIRAIPDPLTIVFDDMHQQSDLPFLQTTLGQLTGAMTNAEAAASARSSLRLTGVTSTIASRNNTRRTTE